MWTISILTHYGSSLSSNRWA